MSFPAGSDCVTEHSRPAAVGMAASGRVHALDDDEVLRTALGHGFSEYYRTTRAWELKAWRETVTDWERERYGRSV